MPTILAIDDSPSLLALLEVRLAPERMTLLTAPNAAEGFALCTTSKPDLVLLDIDMPNETGIELCRRLKSDPRTASIPVIFLTGTGDISSKVEGFDVGGFDYVTKPFHPAELRARIRSALRMKRSHDSLAERAMVDALTGLRNRAYFDERLRTEILASIRHARRVSLVLFDLDHFKQINDVHGHAFGDEVLRAIGELALSLVRACDAACRYGGEELALILTETECTGAVVVAERLRDRIRALELVSGQRSVRVTASFGVAEAVDLLERDRTVDVRSLVVAADEALYTAKRAGRDRVRVSGVQWRSTVVSIVPSSRPKRRSA